MADATVGFLLNNLKSLLLYNAKLIYNVKNEVDSLDKELSSLKAFLIDWSNVQNPSEYPKDMARQIRDLAYTAEDALELYVTYEAVKKARSHLEKVFKIPNYVAHLRNVAAEIQSIRGGVKHMFGKNFANLPYGQKYGRSTSEKKAPIVEEENVVGFEDEMEEIVNLLIGGPDELEVISIVGMAGLGKTTLAKKIYRDPRIEYEFYNRAWVYVSQDYNRKEVFLTILSKITTVTDAINNMTSDSLAEKISSLLGKGKYLVVVDDVWEEKAWKDLQAAFPKNKNRSRILLTSRILNLAKHANPTRNPHCLRFLTTEESWTLLKWKALGSQECPDSELENYGRSIAKECEGLPLAIVIIGGMLLEKGTESYWWQKVDGSVHAYLSLDKEKRMDKFIALSFYNLPYYLKACFLYLGIFPEDFQIPVSKLVGLWIAEGFIQQEGNLENLDLEDIAEEYLEDLVNRNLVMVGERKTNGKVKVCHVHDMVREFCRNEAAAEDFFCDIKQSTQSTNSSFRLHFEKLRRLSIHSGLSSYISSKQFAPRVRSFLYLLSEDLTVSLEELSSFPGTFKLLRVFDGKSIHFKRIPNDLTQLIHLRYLVFSCTFPVLPESLSSLWNLQTLMVMTSSRSFEIKADILKMIQLRHVKINASMKLPKTKSKEKSLIRLPSTLTRTKRSDEKDLLISHGSLQTLSALSPECCTQDVFARAPNLKKLGIRGQLAKLMEVKGGSILFDNLGKLQKLEILKLMNDAFPRPPNEVKLDGLPPPYTFPPKLKKLTLSSTQLDWEHMSTIGLLQNLEILKLEENAFVGKLWQPVDGHFRVLRVLHIGRTDLVSWSASADHFPRLRRLYLRHCSNLYEVPSGLGDISSLQLIDLFHTTKTAAASAGKIELFIKNLKDQRSSKGGGFKLNIFPPEQDGDHGNGDAL